MRAARALLSVATVSKVAELEVAAGAVLEPVTSTALPALVMVVSLEEEWASVELQREQRSYSLKSSSLGCLTSELSVLNRQLQRLQKAGPLRMLGWTASWHLSSRTTTLT